MEDNNSKHRDNSRHIRRGFASVQTRRIKAFNDVLNRSTKTTTALQEKSQTPHQSSVIEKPETDIYNSIDTNIGELNEHNNNEKNKPSSIWNKFLKKLKYYVKKIITLSRKYFNKFFVTLILPATKAIKHFIKKVGWPVIISVFIGTLILLFSMFHFFLANTQKIINNFEQNYSSSLKIEEILPNTTFEMSKIPANSGLSESAEEKLKSLLEELSIDQTELPRPIFSRYALRNAKVDKELDLLYAKTYLSLINLQNNTEDMKEILEISRELFSKDIKQTDEYISFLKNSIKRIEKVDEQNSDLDLKTIVRIFTQILNSAEEFKVNQNKVYFNQQAGNVGSEIYKELTAEWSKSVEQPYIQWLSARRSSLESILNSL